MKGLRSAKGTSDPVRGREREEEREREREREREIRCRDIQVS
jgi:hypothetical protein